MLSNQRTVLHVDDDPQLTGIVAAQLERRGFEVVSLSDPTEALPALLNSQIRIALLDLHMPGCDGIELLREIKREDGGIQVIMLTATHSMTKAMAAMRAGAEDCIVKTADNYERITDAIEESFRKIDRWWNTLHEIKHRDDQNSTVPPEVSCS
jgi:DNA-binding NtrC family response regulator